MVGQIREVCRLCLSGSTLEDVVYSKNMIDLISNLLSITITNSDAYASKICHECIKTLSDFRDYPSVQDAATGTDDTIPKKRPCNGKNDSPSSHSPSRNDKNPSSISSTKRFQAIVISSTGKKRYIYDCSQTYRKQLIECDICHKCLPKTRLEGHRNVHLGLRPWNCERGCEQSFHCKQLLLHHYRNVHNGETHCCDVCGKVFRSKRSLGYHKKDSHGEKTHPCSFCDQLFVSNSRLNQHLKYHRGERKYPCERCEYSFYSSNDLKKHLVTHDNRRPGRLPTASGNRSG
uniref:C2H2-type domain-containing protein n=1 Tax=Anopheles christyi TaxID=43041 RepID=A0A182JW13_9DIPT